MKFGTSGLRGLVEDLQGKPAAIYTYAFGQHLIASGLVHSGDCVLVGRDLRPSSPSIAATCIGALRRAGLQPLDCGAIATPALAHMGITRGYPCLMITGSHIPSDRNGLKFYTPQGEITKCDEVAIASIASSYFDDWTLDVHPETAPDHSYEATRLFFERCMGILPPRALRGVKVGVFEHSTVARDLIVAVLQEYGAEVISLGRSEIFIPVDTEAVSDAIVRRFDAWSKEYSFDAIVSADGDGDRPLVADEFGRPVRGDVLGLVSATVLKADAVITPITSNSLIEDVSDFKVVRTRVGSPYVVEGMQKATSKDFSKVLGFEANGGTLTNSEFITPGGAMAPLPTRDSLLPILTTLYLCSLRKIPISKIAENLRLASAAGGRLENFPMESSLTLMEHLQRSERNLGDFLRPLGIVTKTNRVDGLRATLSSGCVVHLRASGNAPEMRYYVEADTQAGADVLGEEVARLLLDWLGKHMANKSNEQTGGFNDQ